MNRFYSRTGDNGETGLLGEGRVMKSDLRMEALGTLDELSATLGLARSFIVQTELREEIIAIQRTLYVLMAEVAATKENAGKFSRVNSDTTKDLEKVIDDLAVSVNSPNGFIIPGGNQASAAVSLARTVARRAERRVAELLDRHILTNLDLLKYLNRLSSYLFVLELHLTQADEYGNQILARDEVS